MLVYTLISHNFLPGALSCHSDGDGGAALRPRLLLGGHLKEWVLPPGCASRQDRRHRMAASLGNNASPSQVEECFNWIHLQIIWASSYDETPLYELDRQLHDSLFFLLA